MVSNKPPILSVSPTLFTLLRDAHYYFAIAFFAFILMHFAVMIFHKLVENEAAHGRECSWFDQGWVFTESGIVGIAHPA